jgi:hypothetical protein
MEIDITPIAITIIAVIGMVFGSKTVLSHLASGSKPLRAKIKEMEEFSLYQKKQMLVYKNKASNMEKGPQINGDPESLGDLLPDIISQFSDYAPKWLQPMLKDGESQKMILKYVQDNPDKAKQFFGKIVGKKLGKSNDSQEQEPNNELSV